MKLVKQRNGVDCGLAVAAMLGACSYDDAAEADPSPESERGLSPSDLIYTLEGLTGEPFSESRKGKGKPLGVYGLPKTPSAILIRESRKPFGHWIATDGVLVFDPEFDSPITLNEYSRQDWPILRIIKTD